MQHVWLAIILAVGPADASAQAQPVGAIAALVGQGTVIHVAAVERAPAKLRDEIFVRDRIETAEQSVIRVLMGGRITVTIRERSIVTITDDPMRSRVDLQSGTLAFKVHEGGLRAGEVAEILTPNAVTAIRGSLVIAQVSGGDSDVTVLEAHKPITIAPRANPTQTTHLPIGHTVRVSGPRHAARIGQMPRDPRAPDTRRRPRRGPRPATRWRPGARVPTRGANRTARATGARPPAAARGRRGAGRAGGARIRGPPLGRASLRPAPVPYEIVLATVAALLFLGAYRARRMGVTMKVTERFQVRDPQTGQLTTYGSLDEMPADIRTRIEQARAGATGESRPLRITATDASGRTRTYDSFEEMPADVRAIYERVIKELNIRA